MLALAAGVPLRRDLLEVADDQTEHGAAGGDQHDQSDPPVPDVGREHGVSVASWSALTPTAGLSRSRNESSPTTGLRPGRYRSDRWWSGPPPRSVSKHCLDPTEQSRRHLVAAALASNRLFELGLEVERLQAVHARIEMIVDVTPHLVRELAVEKGVELSNRFAAVGHVSPGHSSACFSSKVVVSPRVSCVLVQRALHRFSSPMESRHHGADRDVEHLGDLLVREPLDVGEEHRESEVVRELLERLLHLVVGEEVEKLLLGRHAGGCGLHRTETLVQVQVLDVAEIGLLRASLLGPVLVDVGVGEDPEQPCPQVGALLERVEAPETPQVGLLDEVLGVGLIARHAQRRGVELGCVFHGLVGEVVLVGHEGRT